MKQSVINSLFISIILIICSTIAVNAATYTVTNSADSGAGTLRDIISGASNGDIINFDSSVSYITLTNGYININRNISILGPGSDELYIDGNTNSRIFGMAYSGLSVVIAGLTITNGAVDSSTSGGAIYMGTSSDMTLTISNCVITACSSGDNGGALSLREGIAEIINCKISNCTAGDRGGAIYTENGLQLLMNNCIISNNSATVRGGGIYLDSNDIRASITNCIIVDNNAVIDGGGIWLGGVFDISDSKIINNTASDDGGGMFVDQGVYSLTGTVVSCVISNNRCVDEGGGIYGYLRDSMDISNCIFAANIADDSGGAIYSYNNDGINVRNIRIWDSVFSDNQATNSGGAIRFVTTRRLYIDRCTLKGNKVIAAQDGGAIYISGTTATLELANSTVYNNSAGDDAGAIYSTGPILLYNSTISGNTANGDGGGLYLTSTVTQQIYNCTICSNTSQSNIGGGLRRNNGYVELYSTIIAQNTPNDLHGTMSVIDHCLTNISVSVGTPAGAGNLGGDPLFYELADNGGPTMTHALQKYSPAISAGSNPLLLEWDQRGSGYNRSIANIDIGAFEYGHGIPLGTVVTIY